jgi:glycosyltransferase involved in cell wall biosynthesis
MSRSISISAEPMKLIVQIPCFNEEETLARTVADIPRGIYGIDAVEVLVIDDGSTDRTVEVARRAGVNHIVSHPNNRGLARSFRTGLDACLKLGADIIVNTDGDNQYAGSDIPRLIRPILEGCADIVIGDRQTAGLVHFSPMKKWLQAVASRFARAFSATDVPDAVSGFRAISREAALQLNVVSRFSYTIETLIQSGRCSLAIGSVPIRSQRTERASRLFKSIPRFIGLSAVTMVRTYAMYQPLRVFFHIGLFLSVVGLVPVLRFLYLFAIGQGVGHVQSLVLGGVLLVVGFMTFLIGLVADLISFNRQLLEMVLEKVRRMEAGERQRETETSFGSAFRNIASPAAQASAAAATCRPTANEPVGSA